MPRLSVAPPPPSATSDTKFKTKRLLLRPFTKNDVRSIPPGIVIGTFFKLPGGDGGLGIMEIIMKNLDIKSLCAFINTSAIKQLSTAYGNSAYLYNICKQRIEMHRITIITALNDKYINQCPWVPWVKERKRLPDPFIIACENGNLKDVQTYVKSGTVKDVNRIGKSSRQSHTRPLPATSSKEVHEYLVNYQVERGATLTDIYKTNWPHGDPFVVSCQIGNLKDVQTFVKSGMIKDVNRYKGKCKMGGHPCTPFRVTTEKEVIDYLLEYQLKGATDLETIKRVYRLSWPNTDPFIVACQIGRLKDVQMFFKSGMVKDINKRGKRFSGSNIDKGWCKATPLSAASRNGHQHVIDYLVNIIYNKDTADLAKQYLKEFPEGDPVIIACREGRLKDVQTFINGGMIKDVNKYQAGSLLGIASRCEQYEIVKYLLTLPGIDVGAVGETMLGLGHTTALQSAAWTNKNNLDVLNCLLNHKRVQLMW